MTAVTIYSKFYVLIKDGIIDIIGCDQERIKVLASHFFTSNNSEYLIRPTVRGRYNYITLFY